ncbi:DMT family transporter [Pseudomonas oryzihabitans]|uniref:DMT family transporter n=1 Tax=Pseudomonas oryzihabitans TaxID=47885 RepID=UPI00286764C8|nr:DMT family transporter [Pseudomonas psychrotolerans]MDR6679287.1 drug/metabolite transporter (DMT)-like permease [Pseudomonas psychrotolerans]
MGQANGLRLLLLAAIWGASFLFMRIAVPAFGAVNTAFLRVALGALGLAALLLLMRRSWRFAGKFWSAALLGVVNSGLPFLLYCLAARSLPAGYSALLNATTPLMGALIGCACFGEVLSRRKWLGVFAGFLGVALIVPRGGLDTGTGMLVGIAACLLATACYGTAGYLARRWIGDRGGLDATLVAFGSQAGATLFLLPFSLATLAMNPLPAAPPMSAWLSVLAVGLLCTALAYSLYFRLLADLGPLRTLSVTFLVPPFGVLWGYLVLGETLAPNALLGALVIGLAVWLVLHSESTVTTRW